MAKTPIPLPKKKDQASLDALIERYGVTQVRNALPSAGPGRPRTNRRDLIALIFAYCHSELKRKRSKAPTMDAAKEIKKIFGLGNTTIESIIKRYWHKTKPVRSEFPRWQAQQEIMRRERAQKRGVKSRAASTK